MSKKEKVKATIDTMAMRRLLLRKKRRSFQGRVRIKNEFHRWCKDYGFTDLHRAALKIILEGGSAFQPAPKKMTAVKVSAAERKEANKTCKLVPTTPRRQIEGHRCQSPLVSSTQGRDPAATVSS